MMSSVHKANHPVKGLSLLHPRAASGERMLSGVGQYQKEVQADEHNLHATHTAWMSRARNLASLLDAAWAIPGTKIRFGADSLLGLIPGAGDVLTSGLSAYLLYGAWRHGTSKWTLARMSGNILIDLLFGSIPLLGDLFDLVWKSNQRNVRLLEKDFAARLGRHSNTRFDPPKV